MIYVLKVCGSILCSVLFLMCNALCAAVDFAHDVIPLLSRLGCNSSTCHGKAEGQNGFKLSVFANNPKNDSTEYLNKE